jgi:hypothetical protein
MTQFSLVQRERSLEESYLSNCRVLYGFFILRMLESHILSFNLRPFLGVMSQVLLIVHEELRIGLWLLSCLMRGSYSGVVHSVRPFTVILADND